MRLAKLLRAPQRAPGREAASGQPEALAASAPRAPVPRSGAASVGRSSAAARAAAARIEELRAQARFARERYDLYKAKTYGPRLTSPARLEALARESERAQASLSFAEDEAARHTESQRDEAGSG